MDSPRGEPIFDGGMMTDSRGVPAAVEGSCYRDPYEYKGQLLKTSRPRKYSESQKGGFSLCGAEAKIPVCTGAAGSSFNNVF
jgi:hypothetical protein